MNNAKLPSDTPQPFDNVDLIIERWHDAKSWSDIILATYGIVNRSYEHRFMGQMMATIERLRSAEQSEDSAPSDADIESEAQSLFDGPYQGRARQFWSDGAKWTRSRMKQALQPTRVTITVNMREHQVEGGAISYERVAELAGKPGASHLTISYERGGAGGTLIPGESAPLSDGMHFCATNTSNA